MVLIAFYATMAVILRPEALPGPFPQALIWLVYAVVFVLGWYGGVAAGCCVIILAAVDALKQPP